MNFRRIFVSCLLSAVVLAALLYYDPGSHEQPAPTRGDRAASILFGGIGTVIYLAFYLFSDVFRRWRGWAAWTLCPVVAAGCAVIVTFVFFQPVEVSGFHGVIDALYFFGVIFLPSLPFGLCYTALYYDPQRRDAQP